MKKYLLKYVLLNLFFLNLAFASTLPAPLVDYHFDECIWNGVEGEVKDSSGNDFSAKAIKGETTVSDGQVNRSGKFSNIGYVKATNISTFNKNSFSASIWVKFNGDALHRYHTLVIKEEVGGHQYGVFKMKYDGLNNYIRVHGRLKDGTNFRQGAEYDLDDDRWHHIVTTFDNGVLKIYVDNTLVLTKTGIGELADPNSILTIGGTGVSNYPSNTNIDEVKIYNIALSIDEINTIYNNESQYKNYDGSEREKVLCIAAEYRLDKCKWLGEEDEVEDFINDNHGKTNDIVLSQGGKVNQATYFNESYVEIEPDFALGSEPFLISFWMNLESDLVANYMGILSKEVEFYLNQSKKLVVNLKNNSSDLLSTTEIELDKWTHIALANDGKKIELYINGILNNKIAATDIGLNGINTIFVGKTPWDNPSEGVEGFKGGIDELKIFKGVMSQAYIESIYNNEKDGKNSDGSGREKDTCKYICSNPKPFELTYSANVRGDMKIIGNSILCGDADVNGICDDPGPDVNVANNDINMINMDIDNDNTTYNSSSAKLVMPEGSEILWAKLYWQGRFYKASENESNRVSEVKFKIPGSTTYIEVDENNDSYEHNWIYLNKDSQYYQASIDVTEAVKEGGAGWYSVANIFTHSAEHELFISAMGGWSIVVAYKNNTLDLRNITIFDGYRGVYDKSYADNANNYAGSMGCGESGMDYNVSMDLDGFLTPKNGDVDSKFIIFASEGDAKFSNNSLWLSDKNGDKHVLKNTANPDNNPLNSTISDFGTNLDENFLNPFYSTNKLGIDIDTFDTSSIMENEQNSTVITLNGEGDLYYPGVFAFSTQIYEPEICYIENVYLDGLLYDGAQVKPGRLFDMEAVIRNNGQEQATNISTIMPFKNTLEYSAGSIKLDNIPKTDGIGDDQADATDKNITARIGDGAGSINGGSLDYNSSSTIFYQARVLFDENGSSNSNIYEISYKNDFLGLEFKNISLRRCDNWVDLTPEAYKPIIGRFNITDRDKPLTDGNITTKIVNHDINLSLLAFNEDKSALLNDINITVGVVLVDNTTNTIKNLGEMNLSETNGRFEIPNFTHNRATKQANMRVLYCEDPYGNIDADWKNCYPDQTSNCNPKAGYECKESNSWDDFAIRPNKFNIKIPAAVTSGDEFNISIQALDILDQNTTGYNEFRGTTFDLNVSEQLVDVNCTFDDFDMGGFNFYNGSIDLDRTYDEIGNLDFNISEINGSEFAFVDRDDTLDNQRLIQPDDKSMSFNPNTFGLDWNLTNFNNKAYTLYDDNQSRMGAELTATITAHNKKGEVTTNYRGGCYAKSTDFDINLNIENEMGQNMDLRIVDLNDSNTSNFVFNEISPSATKGFVVKPTRFDNGIGVENIHFNFKRVINRPLAPVKLNITKIRVDDGSIDGEKSKANESANFIYAKAHAPNQSVVGKTLNAMMQYEAFVPQGMAKADYGMNGFKESSDYPNWYLLPVLDSTLDYSNPRLRYPSGADVNKNDASSLTIEVEQTPHNNRVFYTPPQYLLYNKFSTSITTHNFLVQAFSESAPWTGKGKEGKTINRDASNRGLMKMDW